MRTILCITLLLITVSASAQTATFSRDLITTSTLVADAKEAEILASDTTQKVLSLALEMLKKLSANLPDTSPDGASIERNIRFISELSTYESERLTSNIELFEHLHSIISNQNTFVRLLEQENDALRAQLAKQGTQL